MWLPNGCAKVLLLKLRFAPTFRSGITKKRNLGVLTLIIMEYIRI